MTNKGSDTREIICVNCGAKFIPARAWQKFCSESCRHAYHNREKLGGIILPARLRYQLEELANAQDKSLSGMAAIIINEALNPGLPLLDADIWGRIGRQNER